MSGARKIAAVNADGAHGRCRLFYVVEAHQTPGPHLPNEQQIGAVEDAVRAHDGGPRVSFDMYPAGGLTVAEWRALVAAVAEQLEAMKP